MINLEKYSESFQHLLKGYQKTSRDYTKLKNLSDAQKNDLETIKNNEISLKKELNISKTVQRDNNLLADIIHSKNLYETTKNENESLKQFINRLNDEHEAEKIRMRNDHNKERDLLRDNQRGLLAKLEENYRTHISELEKKEKDLTESLNAAQNKSAMEYDLMQTNLTEMLVESNRKLKELDCKNTVLRYELQNLKNRSNVKDNICKNNNDNDVKIQILKNELIKAENCLLKNRHNAIANNSNNNKTNVEESLILTQEDINEFQNDSSDFFKIIEESHVKYEMLDVLPFDNNNNKHIINDNNDKKWSYQKNKTYLPPLVQVKSSFQNVQTAKKRKLYNPEENEFCQ